MIKISSLVKLGLRRLDCYERTVDATHDGQQTLNFALVDQGLLRSFSYFIDELRGQGHHPQGFAVN